MYYPSSENKGAGMISFAVTAKLICAFAFAYAECWFSHEAAQLVICFNCAILQHNEDTVTS